MKEKLLNELNQYEIQNYSLLEEYVDFCVLHNTKQENTEEHHILPQAEYPQFSDLENNVWNCAYLTPAEHLMAHSVLAHASTQLSGGIVALHGYRGYDCVSNMSEKEYNEVVSIAYREGGRKQSETKSDKEWKETIGKAAAQQRSAIFNDEYWKATKGKEKVRKDQETKADPTWKATIGKEQSRKQSEIKADLEWKATTGKEQSRKISETKMAREIPVCPHCGKQGKNGASWANMKRWHFENCKEL